MQSIFKSIYGSDWKYLPVSIRRFLSISPSNPEISIRGKLEVKYSLWMWLMVPIHWLLRLKVPRPGKNIVTTGALKNTADRKIIGFNRQYQYPNGKIIDLISHWHIDRKFRVTEFIGRFIGWRFVLDFDGEDAYFLHDAFVFNFFGKIVKIPFGDWFIGRGFVQMKGLNEQSFHIKMTLRHFWGIYYQYDLTIDNIELLDAMDHF